MPAQEIFPGLLKSASQRELQRVVARNALERLWSRNISLWPAEGREAESIQDNLRWLDLPELLPPLVQRVVARSADIEPAGLEDVVFIALGTSSAAAEAVLDIPSAKLGKRTFLLNTIDPDAVRALETTLRLARTLFIFPSKFGKNIDAHSLFLYFLEQLKARSVPSPANHFIALAEESSFLGVLAGEYQFIDRFFDPPGIIGRFSGLIHFNFFLAALLRFDCEDLFARTRSMRDACKSAAALDRNPALSLSALLAACHLELYDRLALYTSENLKPFGRRIGGLVGASTCRNGRGFIPLVDRPSFPSAVVPNSLSVCITMAGEKDQAVAERIEQLRTASAPFVTVELSGPEEFAAELFKWEIATALACVLLETNPFHQPDLRESRERCTQILDQFVRQDQWPPTSRVRDGALELFAEGDTRRELSSLSMVEALRSFFQLRQTSGYLALLAFMDLNTSRLAKIEKVRSQLESKAGIPVVVNPGPQYLHTLASVYREGPAKGLFIFLTADPTNDLPIPGSPNTFGQMQLALAQADFEQLGRKGKHVIRLHLVDGADSGLEQLEAICNHLPPVRGFGA